jgi:hypothetical protein
MNADIAAALDNAERVVGRIGEYRLTDEQWDDLANTLDELDLAVTRQIPLAVRAAVLDLHRYGGIRLNARMVGDAQSAPPEQVRLHVALVTRKIYEVRHAEPATPSGTHS